MKRKALVAAIAGILSAPAVAAIDDAGMKYTSASEGFYGSIRTVLRLEDDKDANLANNLETSRLGVRGSVDLGGGVSATYRYEWDIEADPDFASQRLRQVGLTGNIGTLTFGRQWNVDYDYVFSTTDATNSGSGNFTEAFRWPSSFRYDSKDINGFTFSAQAQMDGSGDDSDDDVDMFAFGAQYSAGGATIAGVYINERSVPFDLADAQDEVRSVADVDLTFRPVLSTTNPGREFDLLVGTNAAGRLSVVGEEELTDDTIGIALGYGGSNWQVNYFFKRSSHFGFTYICDGDPVSVDSVEECEGVVSGNDLWTVTVNDDGKETAHSFSGQAVFGKITLRGVYETREMDYDFAAFDKNVFVGEAQYDLGSRARVWAGFTNTDDDQADDEVTQFNLGYRVDF